MLRCKVDLREERLLGEGRDRQGKKTERGPEQVKLAVDGAVAAISSAGSSISAGALGVVLGYFLGAGRLARATIIISVVGLFFGLVLGREARAG